MIEIFEYFRLRWAGLLVLFLSLGTQAAPLDTLRFGEARAVMVRREVKSGVPTWTLDSLSLQQRGVVTTADALRRLPGVNLRDYGGAGGLKTVSVRGLGASHTVVTHDGLPVGDARMGQVDFRRFPLHRLQSLRLSVADAPDLLVPVRALGSATVQLQSKSAGNALSLQAGSWGMIAPALTLSRKLGRSTFGAAADYYHGDNNYPFTLTNVTLRTRERREHSQMNNGGGELSHQYADATTVVNTRAHYHRDRQALPGPVTLYTTLGTEDLREQDAVVQSTLRRRWSHTLLMAGAKHSWQESKYTNRDGQYPGGRLEQFYWQRETYVTLGVQRDVAQGWQMAYAADYTHTSLNSNLRVDNDVRRHSLQQSFSLRHRRGSWQATARALLHQHWNHVSETAALDPLFGSGESPAAENAFRLTPSLSVSGALWQTSSVQFAGNVYAQALFRMPSFTESYYFHYGNRHLRPERTRQLGAGLSGRMAPSSWGGGALEISVDAYLNRIADRILAIPLSPHVWRTTNLNRVRAYGLDAALAAHWPLAAAHRLSVQGHYSWQRVTDRTTATPATLGKQLPYTPPHSGSLSLSWDNPWVRFVLSATAASERWATHDHAVTTRLPPYAELGASLSKSFRLGRQRLDLRFDVTNLTDHSYEILRRYPMPGRAWRTSFVYTF